MCGGGENLCGQKFPPPQSFRLLALLHLIDNAIANIEDEKHFRIKVAGDNVSFLEKHKDEILDYVGHDIELEIVPDYTLNENACTIETDAGIFDCGVDVQLDNLMKDIKALCS